MNIIQKPDNDIHFSALLILNKYENDSPNLKNNINRFETYVSCAANLERSLNKFGYDITLYTNDTDLLLNIFAISGLYFKNIQHVSTDLNVPQGVGFASAHHKIELLQHLGDNHPDGLVALIDLDTEMVKPLPKIEVSTGNILTYNMTSAMKEEFGNKFKTDLELLSGQSIKDAAWYGGEFILGYGRDIKKVSCLSASYMETYAECWPRLVHQGDEILISAAINALRSNGEIEVKDAGQKLVTRYWSTRTNVSMPPLLSVADRCIIHLPADKEFLQMRAHRNLDIPFLVDYIIHRGLRILVRQFFNAFLNLFRNERKRSPKIFY